MKRHWIFAKDGTSLNRVMSFLTPIRTGLVDRSVGPSNFHGDGRQLSVTALNLSRRRRDRGFRVPLDPCAIARACARGDEQTLD